MNIINVKNIRKICIMKPTSLSNFPISGLRLANLSVVPVQNLVYTNLKCLIRFIVSNINVVVLLLYTLALHEFQIMNFVSSSLTVKSFYRIKMFIWACGCECVNSWYVLARQLCILFGSFIGHLWQIWPIYIPDQLCIFISWNPTHMATTFSLSLLLGAAVAQVVEPLSSDWNEMVWNGW